MPVLETIFAGSMTGAFLNVLLDRLASPDLWMFLRKEGFARKINNWQSTIEIISAFLGDAEEKQQKDKAVQMWLDDLEELAYDAEDILDRLEYEAIARKMKTESDKFWKHFPAGFSHWGLDAMKFRSSMNSEVNRVADRFNQLGELRVKLGLQVTTGGQSSSSVAAQQRPPTAAHRTEPAIYGRDEDKNKVLELVLTNQPNTDSAANFCVIPIVGMAGVGKTTLAREVFIASKDEFKVSAWVCVSNGDFDVPESQSQFLRTLLALLPFPMN